MVRRVLAPVLALLGVLAVVLAVGTATAQSGAGGGRGPGDGAPRPGADPANQPPPSSLTVTARKAPPSDVDDPGVNTGRTKPAKDVKGKKQRIDPDSVLEESSARGGCTAGYGGGEACLPVVPPSAAQHAGHGMTVRWTCAEARLTLPRGISVLGDDPLGLDTNRDRVACGPGDRDR